MPDVGGVAGDRLRSFIERIERLEEEKKTILDDIKEVFAEAKGTGFDTKIMREIIKIRRMDQADRDEFEALLDIYKAALGMLSDTPLGESAIKRLSPDPAQKSPPEEAQSPKANGQIEEDRADEPPPEPGPTVEEARAMGATAAERGDAVVANPFPARDPRRAAWDEGYCMHSGSDGMDLPDIWRRKPKKPGTKPPDIESPAP